MAPPPAPVQRNDAPADATPAIPSAATTNGTTAMGSRLRQLTRQPEKAGGGARTRNRWDATPVIGTSGAGGRTGKTETVDATPDRPNVGAGSVGNGSSQWCGCWRRRAEKRSRWDETPVVSVTGGPSSMGLGGVVGNTSR